MEKRMRAYSPREVGAKKYKVLPWDGKWKQSFGCPTTNEMWFISGASAQGKSSFVMQLAKKLCEYGRVLYISAEEGIRQSFQRRLKMFKMHEVNTRLLIIDDSKKASLDERPKKHKSPSFIILDSFQMANWTYEDAMEMVEKYRNKSFIFISQEDKSRPLGRAAVRLRYAAGIKIRVSGFVALCSGREKETAGAQGYIVWDEGALRYGNNTTNEREQTT